MTVSPSHIVLRQNRSLQVPMNTPPPPPPSFAVQPFTQRAGEPSGSQGRQPTPALPNMTDRPVADQSVVTALQAVVFNPHYADFMRSTGQYWHELRRITLPTKYPESHSTKHTTCLDGSTHQRAARALSPYRNRTKPLTLSRSTSGSQKGEGSTDLPRERETTSPARMIANTAPQNAPNSPSSKPLL